MKTARVAVVQQDIDFALHATPWDMGNQVLYDLCSKHPGHSDDQAIIAKIWLIGRSYAAALERRKNKKESSDDFYETVVVPHIKQSSLDAILTTLPDPPVDPIKSLPLSIAAHNAVMAVFQDLAELDKRSLASKYLHFHRRDIFYIYDSRAQTAISALTPDAAHVPDLEVAANRRDETYWKFCRRVAWLHSRISNEFKANLDPRGIDKVLLHVHRRILAIRPTRKRLPIKRAT